MQNSINIDHKKDLIFPSFDGSLWVKNTTKWESINQHLYKNEKKLPTNDIGINGDYYAKYIRLYNYIKYSENFNAPNWIKTNTKITKEPLVLFPYNQCSKMTSSTVNAEHRAEYIFYNDLTSTFTFSLYVKTVELTNIAVCLMDNKEIFGVNVLCDISKNNATVQKIDTDFGEIQIHNGGISKISDDIYRVYVTAKFKTSLILKCIIKLLDKNNNPIFSTINDSYGIFINAAQLTKSDNLSQYTFTNGMYSSVAILQTLYKKIDDEWKSTSNVIYYFDEAPKNGMGSVGDIAVRDAILTIAPVIRVGNSKNVKDSQKLNGTLFYDAKNDRIYVHTNRGNYYLVYKYPKNKTHDVSMAISLSQKTYQTYDKYGRASYFKGYNTGGNYNFWGNEFRRDY